MIDKAALVYVDLDGVPHLMGRLWARVRKNQESATFEYDASWRLSPAYDLNPVPTDIKPRILATAINEEDNTASLSLAMEVAGYFDLDAAKAREIAAQVGKVVSKWRDEASRHGLSKAEIDRMASAFQHEDLHLASGRQ